MISRTELKMHSNYVVNDTVCNVNYLPKYGAIGSALLYGNISTISDDSVTFHTKQGKFVENFLCLHCKKCMVFFFTILIGLYSAHYKNSKSSPLNHVGLKNNRYFRKLISGD